MQLSYQKKGSYSYAKIPGDSYRENGYVKNAMQYTEGVMTAPPTGLVNAFPHFVQAKYTFWVSTLTSLLPLFESRLA